MNHGYPTNWPIVTRAQFERVMGEFDYCRDGWSDCIVYYDRTVQRWGAIGYEIDGPYSAELSNTFGHFKREPPTFRLHPDLAREGES